MDKDAEWLREIADLKEDDGLPTLSEETQARLRSIAARLDASTKLLRLAEIALNDSYNAQEWPANGTSYQEQVRDKIREALTPEPPA